MATPMATESGAAGASASSVASGAASADPSIPAADTSAWTVLAPDGAGFSARMPGEAKTSTMTIKTPAGDAPTNVWSFTDASNRMFTVTQSKFQAGTLSKAPVAKVLDGSVSGAASAMGNLTVASQTDTTLDGHAGRAFVMTSSKANVQGLVLPLGDTEYILSVSAPAGMADDGSAAAFFASFKLAA